MELEKDAARKELWTLTLREILGRLKGVLQFSNKLRSNKELLIEHVLSSAPAEHIEFLRQLAQTKKDDKTTSSLAVKRKRTENQQARRQARRVETIIDGDELDNEIAQFEEDHNIDQFLKLPTEEEVRDCYRRFHEATSNNALELSICGVCAREVSMQEEQPTVLNLKDVPNSDSLVPISPHPQHDLYAGVLLEPRGVIVADDEVHVRICRTCLRDLNKSKNNPPRLSLANNMWIGRTPWQLDILTFAEQLLIAHVYPRVYTFKLFPKKVGNHDQANLQRGMRGNVSSYELNMDSIANMLEGDLMPRPPEILASIITITFIGVGDLPKRSLWNTFRVRRHVIAEALEWLKENNQKYYGKIQLNQSRLRALPEEDIPQEIIDIVHQSNDVGVVDQESDGYVPREEAEPDTATRSNTDTDSAETPDVIPWTVSGTTDTDLSKITANELMTWGLENLWKDGKETPYAVRHGKKPVNDFGRPLEKNSTLKETLDFDHPNYFERAFPCLFHFGRGGIEADRPNEVSFGEHIKWALQYHDRRFRKHETFAFVAFGIQQRREALRSARLQMRRKNFEADANLLSTITHTKLERARIEEEKKLPISDPAVRLLRKHIHATGGRVMGSDQSRYQLRSQMWSTSIYIGPPSLWITINPCDLHDPIAQIFAGEKIDMDNFLAYLGPDKDKRAKNIAEDPYAAAKFFHFLIKTILETLFGIQVTPYQIRSGKGIYGPVAAYFGAVESQGRGSLHLHIILWLKNAPTADEMLELLKSEEFRERVKAFLRANVHAYTAGLETAEAVKSVPNNVEIAYSRPPHPDSEDYENQVKLYELRLVRAKQVHTCELRRCIIYDSKGLPKCKRRAPFEIAEEEYIDEAGNWAPKRLYPYLNNWNPATLIHSRCNNDIKLLTNGRDTLNIGEYVCSYTGKKQGKNHNLSALMAEGFAFHEKRRNITDNLQDENRLLIFRLVHTINREQELAAPMVMSLLMGWGDVYRSHHYTPIFWSSFTGALLREFPDLSPAKNHRKQNESAPETEVEPNPSTFTENRSEEGINQPGEELVTLQSDSAGRLTKKCQVVDYSLRGDELANFNMLHFFVDTYEVDYTVSKCTKTNNLEAHTGDEVDNDSGHPQRGRRKNPRVRYLQKHPLFKSKQRIVRSSGHTNLPNFIGPYFLRRDDPEIYQFYCASMLVLLKPWRCLKTDLKLPTQTWDDSFKEFISAAPKTIHHILSGIQYFHECKSAVKRNQVNPDFPHLVDHQNVDMVKGGLDLEEDVLPSTQFLPSLTEEGLQEIRASLTPWAEKNHGRHAVYIATRAQIFHDNNSNSWAVDLSRNPVGNATGSSLQQFLMWKAEMDASVNRQNSVTNVPAHLEQNDQAAVTVTTYENSSANEGDVFPYNPDAPEAASRLNRDAEISENSIPPIDPSYLKPDQRRAYDIVTWHLYQTLSGTSPPPLRMILHGEGGTGKSKVIQTITQAFAQRGVSSMLLKSAYTGVAASLIDGKTTHTIGMIPRNGHLLSSQTKAKLQAFWKNFVYLIIDEYSMISKAFLAKLSRNIGIGKTKGSVENPEASHANDSLGFGGINVILCGDLHQFPPVAGAKREPLYFSSLSTDSTDLKTGRMIYEEFTTVVVLREQVRVMDIGWRDFLRRLRKGVVQENDLTMLRKLLITHPECPPTEFDSTWSDLHLVTPRHAVRTEWNNSAVKKHCKQSKQQLFICKAEDTIRDRPLRIAEQYAVALRGKGQKTRQRQNELPENNQLAIGMKVMVTQNVETDLDITNGARGTIVDIILDKDEPSLPNENIVELAHLPAYVLVRLDRTRVAQLAGLPPCVIPVAPASTSFTITVMIDGKPQNRTVKRRQFPMTAAYAFTDYRSQGQTIPYVLVDIASPPTGGLSLFNLYVALSRSSGRSTIRLLRDFNDETFKATHDPELLAEDDRLDYLDEMTKKWWKKLSSVD